MTLAIFFSSIGFSQDSVDEQDLNAIEAELEKSSNIQKKTEGDTAPDKKVENLSDLSRLSPFSEISVVQRRYLPKTKRFQAFAGLQYATNDPWYWGLGLNGKFGYFFSEALGLEGTYSFLSSSEKDAIKDLYKNHNVTTSSLVSPKSYTGLDLVWTPIYGKLGLTARRIVPFDMYFSLGGGSTGTADGQNASTLHFGTGQIYALTKARAFRWDFSWNRFNAKSIDGKDSSFDNLLLTMGFSFFFPEANYR